MVSRLKHLVFFLVSLPLLATACAKESPKKFNLSERHQDRQLIVTFTKGSGLSLHRSSLDAIPADAVALNDSSYLLKFKNDLDLEKMAEKLTAIPGIRSVEANVIYKLFEKTPNDSEFAKLYGMSNTGQANGVAGADIGVTKAWDQTTGSKAVLVGIIDSGMDYNHPDLYDNVWNNPGETGLDASGRDKRSNGIDDDGNGFVDDWHGWDFYNDTNNPIDENNHGTHVAGTIGAVGDNGKGVVGVNWNVSMVPIKVFNGAGETSTDMLVKGIDYATKLGVFVTNNSWGSTAYSEAIFAAIEKASAANILFVAAAGNDGRSNDVVETFPANYNLPNIISVAAINRRDALSGFSNYGSTVDVAAPGEDIYSTFPGGTYAPNSGTSMAAPHVTGALALIRSEFLSLPPLEIKEKILTSSVLTPALKDKVVYGRINVANAMERDIIAPAIVGGFDVLDTSSTTVAVTWNLSGDDGDFGEATSYSIRMSDTPILNATQWDAAETARVVDLKRVGTVYTATIKDLAFNRTGFVAIRATDNVGNVSELSDSIPFTLKKVEVLWSEENEATHKWEAFGTPWEVTVIDGRSVVSDSPKGFYANSLDKSVVSKEINLVSPSLSLEVVSRYQLENAYDFGMVELSTDGGLVWKTVGKVTGNSDWTTTVFDLMPALGSKTSFKIRLRLKSDQSVNYEGWDIDSLTIKGQKD